MTLQIEHEIANNRQTDLVNPPEVEGNSAEVGDNQSETPVYEPEGVLDVLYGNESETDTLTPGSDGDLVFYFN